MEANIQNAHQHNLATQGSRASWVLFTETPDTLFIAI